MDTSSSQEREPPDGDLSQMFRAPGFGRASSRYTLLGFVLLRGLSFIYLVAFLVLALQLVPLFGAEGLLPAVDYLAQVRAALGSGWAGFARLPSVFWLSASNTVLIAAAWLGVFLSVLAFAGIASAPIWFLLWALYLSFVHVGQVFYGYGWESLLCEAGFLAIFMSSPLDPRPLGRQSAVSTIPVVLFRWLTFRVMFGAGLIKVRGDPCWLDLTCLVYHYETQPNPNPLSYYFHQLPVFFHQLGVVVNHFVELIAPFGVFGPRRLRHFSGACIVGFQIILIASGNLSFLNWLTLVVALACFDDGLVARFFPSALRERARLREARPMSRPRRAVLSVLAVGVAFLSLNPLVNLLSARQRMNASFDPFLLVNTYGAFGSIEHERREVMLQGTNDPLPSARNFLIRARLR